MFSDTVMIAMTTGVTINVLACFLGVIRGLFPAERHDKNTNKNRDKKKSKDRSSGKLLS